jgi:hypothetical protein
MAPSVAALAIGEAQAAVSKLSQITAAWSGPALTDTAVGVQGGTTDLQWSWLQIQKVIGGLTTLTADTTYNVSPSGNDSTGTGSVGAPWATLQHAFNYIGGVNANGHAIIIQLADGTYNGAHISTVPLNAGNNGVTVQGHSGDASKVVITDVWPQGGAFAAIGIDIIFPFLQFSSVTFNVSNGANDGIDFNTAGCLISFSNCVFTGTTGANVFNMGSPYAGAILVGSNTVSGTWSNDLVALFATGAYFVSDGAFVISGTPSFGGWGLDFSNNKAAVAFYSTITGGISGNWLNLDNDGLYVGPLATGTVANTLVNGVLNSVPYRQAIHKSGLPATTDIASGVWTVVKDTSGGGVYLAYNDAGTIKKVALT